MRRARRPPRRRRPGDVAGAAGCHRAGGWPSCSPATPPHRPEMLAAWRPAGTTTAWHAAPTWRWQPRAVAAAARADRRRRARRAARAACAALRAEPARARPARRGCRCSARPGCRPRTARRARRARPSTATCTCGCRTPPPRCGPGGWPARSPAARCRRAPPTRRADAAAHPLLSSLGRDVRELQLRAGRGRADRDDEHHPLPRPAAHPARPAAARAARRSAARRTTGAAATGDRSVQVHACHGPAPPGRGAARGLLGLLADDPTLEPRDVAGHVPRHRDVRAADLGRVRAGRAGADRHPGQRLRVRLADRALRQVNPLLDVVGHAARPGRRPGHRRQVLDLLAAAAGAPAVRLRRRRPRAAARAGRRRRGALGPRRRAPAAVRAGGVRRRTPGRPGWTGCCSASRWPSDEQPLAGHRPAAGRRRAAATSTWSAGWPSSSTGSAGVLDELSGERPLDRLGRPRSAGPSTLLTATAAAEAWQAAQARAELAEATREAGPHADHGAAAAAPTSARCWPTGCAAGPTRADFRTGTLTVCHAGADALGAAPRGVPARPRRRRVPARRRGRRRRRAGPRPAASASATPAARTASCCSTR